MPALSVSDFRWLAVATAQASNALHDKWRVGAVIVGGGRVLGVGFNRYRNDPSQVELNGVSYHAEQVAIRRAGDVRGATIYVARITKSGYIGMAKPCPNCQELLMENGIHRAVWTETDGWGKSRLREGVLL
jgi:tRNA(Arg) A34 adenosine deaminase TadA